MIKKVLLIAAALILAISCSKNNPTSPNGGGGGGIGTTPQPTPSSFIEQLKTIDIVKAGDQQWDFKTIKEDATGKILTIEAMNGNKSGNLRGLQSYIGNKLYEISQNFKYALSFEIYNGTASDGNGNTQNANSDALEVKITFSDRETGNIVTDPDFKDGFTLKIVANAKWAETPAITQADIEESLHKVGNINLGLNFDFKNLTLTKAPDTQYNYSYEGILRVDNSSGKTADLIQFVENISKANSTTSYLKISYFSSNGDNTFDVEFKTTSGDKVFNSSSTIKLTVVGTDNQKPVFGLRDLNVSISGNPTITTDNSGNSKGDKITINTDAPYLGLQATKIEQLSGTTINIASQDIGNYVYGSYYPPENVSHIFIDGEAITLIHNTLKDGETAQFKVTFAAFAEGYNPKGGLELTINVKKGQSLPEITLNDFNASLNTMNIAGFNKQVNAGTLTLTSTKDITPTVALNTIKESLKKLSLDKIVIDVNRIEYISWLDNDIYDYPIENLNGALKIYVSPSEKYVFSDEVNKILEDQYGETSFTIIVTPYNNWIPDISIDGAGSSSDNPIKMTLGDAETAPEISYKIKLPQNGSIYSIEISEFKQADGIADNWNILSKNIKMFEDKYTPDTVLTSKAEEIKTIVTNYTIAKDATQVYKVTLTVGYSANSYRKEKIDLYIELLKDYFIVADPNYLSDFLVQTFYDKKTTEPNRDLSINISDTVVLTAKSYKYDYRDYKSENHLRVRGENLSGQGSIPYLNRVFNTPEVISRIRNGLAYIGLEWTGNQITFEAHIDSEYENVNSKESAIATIKLSELKLKDKYLFKDLLYAPINSFSSRDFQVEIRTVGQTWLEQ